MQMILQDLPLGRNIRTIRLSKEMTQKEVAEKLHTFCGGLFRILQRLNRNQ